MVIKKIFGIFLLFFIFLACTNVVQAGFGISPPYVKPKKAVFPGSHYEQKITLLRSSADTEMTAIVTVAAPEMDGWVSVDKGFEFALPKGSLQIPMIVMVDVPKDAEIGNYKGNFNIRIVPKSADNKPGVAIALGARVDIDINVTNEEFFDFAVKRVTIPDIGVLKKPWSWKIFSYFFYKINTVLKIENIGNVVAGPTKVHLDVYDVADKKMLESGDDVSIEKVDPFVTSEVTASFRTDLPPGFYWGRVKVYKDNDIIHKDKITFEIKNDGQVSGIMPWLMLFGLVLLFILVLLSFVKIKVWRYVFGVLYVVFWPLRMLLKLLGALKNKASDRFWESMRQKANEHKKDKG